MSEERLNNIENQIGSLNTNVNTILDSLNAIMQNIPTPPPGGRLHHGRGRGRGNGGRGRGRGFQEEDGTKDLKVEIPDFLGSLDPEDLLDWIRTVERVFEFKGYSDAKAFKVAILKLKSYASLWYENLKNQRRRDGKEPIKTWTKLKKKLKEKFVSRDYTQDMFIRLTQLKQDQNSVESYLRDFEQLTLQCEINEKVEQKIARFVEGLEFRIANRVRMQTLTTFEETVNLALRVEKMGKVKPISIPKQSLKPPLETTTPTKPIEPPTQNKPSTLDKGKTPVFPPKNTTTLKKCYQCQGFGHFAKECPTKRALSTLDVIKWGEDEILICEDEEDEVEMAEELVSPDSGMALVSWRVMHARAQPLEMDQRQQIFRSRCTIRGRVCNLIIDGGSCTNVASTTLVEKLSLPTQEHPLPYKLRWLNKGPEMKVDKQCLVSFSIGKNYVDEVLCDVLPMDACHLLLGRPWEFERDSVHHGRENTYSFKVGSKQVILSPLPPILQPTPTPAMLESSKQVLLLNKTEMEEVMRGDEDTYVRDDGDAYILVSKGGSWSKEIQEEIHSTKIRSTNKLHVQICEMMSEMDMESSNGTSSTPILFVAKGDGSWKTYASGQVLNHMTSKHKIQVLQVGISLDELVEEQVFLNSKQDSNPNQIKVKESHDWGTIFEPKPNKRSAGLFGWSTIPEIKGEPLRWMAKSSTFPMVRISMVQGTFRVFMSEIQASSDRTPMPSEVHTLSCATLNLSAEGVEQRKFQEIFKPNYPHAERKKPPWVVVNSLDLRPCYEGIDEEVSEDLRTSPFLEGEIDTNATSTDKHEMAATGGPPTRLRSTQKSV